MDETPEVGNGDGDGDDQIPLPGFRFHPTDEELVSFYLRRKVEKRPISLELIKQIDIYKHNPWDLPCKIKHHSMVQSGSKFDIFKQKCCGVFMQMQAATWEIKNGTFIAREGGSTRIV